MPLVDTHAHLDARAFDEDREEVLARAYSAGVDRIVAPGVDVPSSRATVELARRHPAGPRVHAAVGIHPHEARSAVRRAADGGWAVDDGALAEIASLARGPGVVALGELGLDYHYDLSPRDAQRAVLEGQLHLAHELELPVILHNRESDADLMEIVDGAPAGLRGVLHCFMADRVMADWAIARGLYIGIAGPIGFRNVRHLPDVVRGVPLDRLLVETDSPYLAPPPRRGRRNEPAYVVHVARALADVLDVAFEELARRTTQNARRLFGLA